MRYIAAIIFALLISHPALAKMYKWVDKNGATHYGDTIPPQYAGQGDIELSNTGTVVRKTLPALTPEQRQAKEEAAEKQRIDAQNALDQRRKDRALLNSYSNEKEIDLARDRNLQMIDMVIQGTQTRIKSTQTRLNTWRKQAEAVKNVKRPLPQGLADDIQDSELTLQELNEMVEQKQKEKEAVREKFNQEKRHFRELRAAGEQASAP